MKGKKYLCLAIISLTISGILYVSVINVWAYNSYIPKEIQVRATMLLIGFTVLLIFSIVLFIAVYLENNNIGGH
jgi:hypothetical protein